MFKSRVLIVVCLVLLIPKASFGNKFDRQLFDNLRSFFLEDVKERRVLIYGGGNGQYLEYFKPYVEMCHEINENPFTSTRERVGDPDGYKFRDKACCFKTVEVKNFNERFQMYFLYDWSIFLESGPNLADCSNGFFENLALHNQRGVIVLNPYNQAVIEEKFKKIGFKIDRKLQNKLRKNAKTNKYKKLMVFRNKNPHLYFFSFPRSGRNWLHYSISTMTDRPVVAGGKKYRFFVTDSNRYDPIIHTHFSGYISGKNPDREKDLLMIIVRNPFECLLRQFKYKPLEWLLSTNREHCWFKKNEYFEGLRLFHNWNPKNRIMIYYEDLMSNFENEMKKILVFLKERDASLDDFMDHYEDHRSYMLKIYDQIHGSFSKGRDMFFHSKKMPLEYLMKMENSMKSTYPILWEEYVAKYELKNVQGKWNEI